MARIETITTQFIHMQLKDVQALALLLPERNANPCLYQRVIAEDAKCVRFRAQLSSPGAPYATCRRNGPLPQFLWHYLNVLSADSPNEKQRRGWQARPKKCDSPPFSECPAPAFAQAFSFLSYQQSSVSMR
jgi:hypothetical protein